jgi:ornithine cyclodeaminase
MRIITAAEIPEVISFRDLIERLRFAFRSDIRVPLRHHHVVERPGAADATLLLMPAWTDMAAQGHAESGYIGLKSVTVFPDNPAQGKPTIMGVYLLLSGRTGEPLAIIDGQELTLWRTAAASALASTYLSRQDASRLLVVGAGALAPYLIRAHAAVRPISEVLIWNRTGATAARVAAQMKEPDLKVAATDDLEEAVRGAHIVSCATMSPEPLVRGEWLGPGAHLDLVGGFRPDLRECDDEAVRRARVFVDTRAGALSEAGDIVQPIKSGVITAEDVAGDLFELTRGDRAGRRYYDQITLFKSVGTALEDLAAATLLFERT